MSEIVSESVLARVRLLALDVDGTLTEGAVTFHSGDTESKTFHVHDGLGIVMASLVGLRTVWITGRVSPIVERRARELGITHLRQGVRDKAAVLTEIAGSLGVPLGDVAYMGDDWNDLPAFAVAGVRLAPADAAPELLQVADYVSPRDGGRGAVRDAIAAILTAQGRYDTARTLYLASLTVPTTGAVRQ
ncbi:MAG: HAD hydrolase family protein [Armatimonadetes bacterium]|nr:HAD hydrolase family protein [Armatimonadota bacterium]